VRLAALALLACLVYAPLAGAQQPRSGKEVVESTCFSCHGKGEKGAPKIGDRKAWSKRSAAGLTKLTASAISGVRGMPSHGGQQDLTDLELGRAITEMVNRSGGNWVEPTAKGATVATRSGEAVVKQQCAQCHQTGVSGAPVIGDRAAWTQRMKNGLDNLVRSAIRGHGGMPPRGGQADLADDEIRGAVLYMFNPEGPRLKVAAAAPVSATPPGAKQVVDGIEIYLGVTSATRMRGYRADSEEGRMHGGVPTGEGYYHVNVSLFDASSHAPIRNATVDASVEQPGTSGERKTLDSVVLRGMPSHGEYFRLAARTPYVFTIRVKRPGFADTTEAKFRSQGE